MSASIYKRALVGVFLFALNELLLLLFLVLSFAALGRGVDGEVEAICLEEYPDKATHTFGSPCYNPPFIHVFYALAAALVFAVLVYSLISFLRRPASSIENHESVLDFLPAEVRDSLEAYAGVLCFLLLPVSAPFFLVALVAWSDSQHVCPFGNQCSDAQAMMWFGCTVGVLVLGLFIVLLRFLLRRRKGVGT